MIEMELEVEVWDYLVMECTEWPGKAQGVILSEPWHCVKMRNLKIVGSVGFKTARQAWEYSFMKNGLRFDV